MNPYLQNLKKIEFVVGYACTGKCRHCSQGDHAESGEHISPEIAIETVRWVTKHYPIQTVMAFGGEPLLYAETVYAIMEAAREAGVPHRQVITNGYFTKDVEKMQMVASMLLQCGVNDLLLSVDSFHQEYIPVKTVLDFALCAKEAEIPLRVQPAWLVSKDDDNVYNRQTKEYLSIFKEHGFSENEGNVIFPEGNAKLFLAPYFEGNVPENPYVEDPWDVRCLSIDANGDVLQGNLYKQSIAKMISEYQPNP